jgi:hypothetical protein
MGKSQELVVALSLAMLFIEAGMENRLFHLRVLLETTKCSRLRKEQIPQVLFLRIVPALY